MFVCIWCEDINHGIAKNNQLPWKISAEMQHFKNTTLNHKVVMGYKTFLSIKKVLPNRINFVLTHNKNLKSNDKNLIFIKNLNKFIDENKKTDEIIYIIGGQQIYEVFIPHSDLLIISKLSQDYQCDLKIDPIWYKDFYLSNKNDYPEFSVFYYKKSN